MSRLAFAFLALSFLSISPSLAQSDVRPGLRVGATAATFGSADAQNLERTYGFVIGGQLLFDVAAPIDLQAEIVYARKGTGFDEQSGPDITLTTDAIQLNVLGRADIVEGPVTPYLLGGPYAALEIVEEIGSSGADQAVSSEFLHESDFGLTVGTGLDVPAGAGSIQFDVRYEWGFVNLSERSGGDLSNRTLVFGVGLTL